jgi:GTP cyclohydrolase I
MKIRKYIIVVCSEIFSQYLYMERQRTYEASDRIASNVTKTRTNYFPSACLHHYIYSKLRSFIRYLSLSVKGLSRIIKIIHMNAPYFWEYVKYWNLEQQIKTCFVSVSALHNTDTEHAKWLAKLHTC